MMVSVDGGVHSVAFTSHDGVKSVVLISGVVDDTFGAISFDQGVRSFDDISVASFPLVLDIASVGVMDSVFEIVVGGSLGNKQRYNNYYF